MTEEKYQKALALKEKISCNKEVIERIKTLKSAPEIVLGSDGSKYTVTCAGLIKDKIWQLVLEDVTKQTAGLENQF